MALSWNLLAWLFGAGLIVETGALAYTVLCALAWRRAWLVAQDDLGKLRQMLDHLQ
jgi:hypothetical protein